MAVPMLAGGPCDELVPISALEGAVAAVEKILDRPDVLLDPSSSEAKSIAKDARSFVKLFFDAAQARCPPRVLENSDGLMSIVVDGFEPTQIWEELEVQNVPLRRHLRQSVKRMTSKDSVDLSLSAAFDESTREPAASSTKPTGDARKGRHRKALDELSMDEEDGEEEDAEAEALAEPSASSDAGDDLDDDEEEPQKPADLPKDQKVMSQDGFFSIEGMNKFADLAEASGGMRLDDEAEDSDDFGMLEMDENEDDDEFQKDTKASFADFFDTPDSIPGADNSKAQDRDKAARRAKAMEAMLSDDDDDEEEEEEGLAGDGDELSDEEKELEAQIKKLQAEGGGSDEDDEGEESEAATGIADDEDDEGKAGSDGDEDDIANAKGGKSLYEMDKRLRSLEDEVAKLEEEQLEEKHWSLKGEVSAKQRPLNSLLEVSLDQPMTQLAGSRAGDAADAAGGEDDGDGALDDVPGAETKMPTTRGIDIEAIIKQRIWDETFDDVIRQAALPPALRPQGADEDVVESLNFEKSRIGLGEVYEKQYEAEMLNHKTDAEKQEDKEKTETKSLFAKVMFKLDMLTNAHFTPRPPTLSATGEQLKKVASLKMEETIPLMMSDALLKAPEEVRAPRRHAKERNELNHEERTAARRLKKAGRRKGLEQRVESGELTLAGMRERSAKLQEKNAEAKREKSKVGQIKDAKKRLRSSELLSQAAANAASGASRKDVARQERQKEKSGRSQGDMSSKKLKL